MYMYRTVIRTRAVFPSPPRTLLNFVFIIPVLFADRVDQGLLQYNQQIVRWWVGGVLEKTHDVTPRHPVTRSDHRPCSRAHDSKGLSE